MKPRAAIAYVADHADSPVCQELFRKFVKFPRWYPLYATIALSAVVTDMPADVEQTLVELASHYRYGEPAS